MRLLIAEWKLQLGSNWLKLIYHHRTRVWEDLVGNQPTDGAEKHIPALFYIVNQCSILLLSTVAWLISDSVISYMIAMVALKLIFCIRVEVLNFDQKSYQQTFITYVLNNFCFLARVKICIL